MKFFYDCEFLENGRTVDLISIGVVSEDGREYYAINDEIMGADFWRRIHDNSWLMANVMPHLMPMGADLNDNVFMKSREQIRTDLNEFFWDGMQNGDFPQWWSYYSSYDHIALTQLYGKMMDKPRWLPWYTHDIAVLADLFGVTALLPDMKPKNMQHHALHDARWHRDMFLELARRVENIHMIRI